MKHFKAPLILLGVCLLVLPFSASAKASRNTVGRILLQVEQNGEAWYVNPTDETRVYLPDGTAAYSALEKFGLGITNADLEQIPIGLDDDFEDVDSDNDGLADKLEEALGTSSANPDSDGDSFPDGTEVRYGYDPLGPGLMTNNEALTNQLRGRIVLQVQSRGQAWYVNPEDGKRYYMKDGDSAYQIMRHLSLGVTNATLEEIEQSETIINCGTNIMCYRGAIENGQPAVAYWDAEFDIKGVYVSLATDLRHTGLEDDGYYRDYIYLKNFDFSIGGEALGYLYYLGLNDEDIADFTSFYSDEIDSFEGSAAVCWYENPDEVIQMIDDVSQGNVDADLEGYDFFDCEELVTVDFDV